MPFPFVYLCDLLDNLEYPYLKATPLLPKDVSKYTKDKVITWLRMHRDRLNAFSTDSKAVMAMLQPDIQIDRVYGFEPGDLELVIARALGLPRQHYLDLQKWQTEPLQGDLGACVQRVMENSKIMAVRAVANLVTVEEIDQILLRIAAFDYRSSPTVQSLARTWPYSDQISLIGKLYQRVQGREAKWLTRLLLKSYAPIKFPENLEPGPQHSYLPSCVQLKIHFPSRAPPPIRRDGSRMIAGVVTAENVVHPPTTSRTAPQLSTSTCAPNPLPAENQLTPTAPTSSPQAISSAPIFTPTVNNVTSTPVTSAPPSSPPINLTTASRESRRPSHSAPNQAKGTLASTTKTQTPPPSNSALSSLAQVSASPSRSIQQTPSRTALGTLPQNIPASNSQKSPKSSNHNTASKINTGGNGTCRYSSHHCPLSTCIFLLGPCIPDLSYVTRGLLAWHGCQYITSVRALAHPSLPRRCSRTGKKFRKIVLVESREAQPSVEFLKQVTMSAPQRKGKKELVEVYDWRLLECITKVDQGKQLTYDPWKRTWICKL